MPVSSLLASFGILGLDHYCLHVHMSPSPHFPSYQHISHIGLGSVVFQYDFVLMNYICNGHLSQNGHIRWFWGFGLRHLNLEARGTPCNPQHTAGS